MLALSWNKCKWTNTNGDRSPNPLQSSTRHPLCGGDGGFVSATPKAIDVVVFSKCFQQLRGVSRHDIYGATGQITGVEKLVEVAGNQRISLRRNCNHGIADGEQRHHQ